MINPVYLITLPILIIHGPFWTSLIPVMNLFCTPRTIIVYTKETNFICYTNNIDCLVYFAFKSNSYIISLKLSYLGPDVRPEAICQIMQQSGLRPQEVGFFSYYKLRNRTTMSTAIYVWISDSWVKWQQMFLLEKAFWRRLKNYKTAYPERCILIFYKQPWLDEVQAIRQYDYHNFIYSRSSTMITY